MDEEEGTHEDQPRSISDTYEDHSRVEEFCHDKGGIIVLLIRASYGCIESGKLWKESLTTKLLDLRFIQNRYDDCVFNRSTIVVYVDDLLITCVDDTTISGMIEELRIEFKSVTVNVGVVHSYLGMIFDFSDLKILRVSMEDFVSDILTRFEVQGTENLFKVSEHNPMLDSEAKSNFHTIVATLLYLSKRVRPDILCAVSFMATRVQCATQEDFKKCSRFLMYVNKLRPRK